MICHQHNQILDMHAQTGSYEAFSNIMKHRIVAGFHTTLNVEPNIISSLQNGYRQTSD